MELHEILETVMILCFGLSWPLSVYKSFKSRSTKGKSVFFSFFIALGYVAGITSKILAQNFNLAFYFYFPNIILVTTDICLYFRNRRIEESEGK